MALPINIEDLLAKRIVESNRIEFKGGFNPNPIVRTICAFANDIDNTGGGYIVIGVDEKDGLPILPPRGIPRDEVDGIMKQLVGLCHHIEPLYNPIVEPVEYMSSLLLVIWAPGGHGRPYRASRDSLARVSEKRFYIRRFSSTIAASPDEEKELFYVSSDIPFDDRPNLLARVEDLDLGLMREHLKVVGSDLYEISEHMDLLEVAQRMQLVSGPSEDIRPLNVGILMFSEHPERFFRNVRIEVVSIPEPTGRNMVERTFTGPIQRQLKDALDYLKNFVVAEAVVKVPGQAQARRFFNYPFDAVEEILSNAVYHRSYQIPEPITVRITRQGMDVTSCPGFARSISDENISNRSIRGVLYRNRRIGDYLKELGLTEGRNTGFPNAYAALEANGSPALEFDMDERRNYLCVTIPVHPHFLTRQERGEDDYERRVMAAIEGSPLTLTQLAHAMGYKGITKKLKSEVEWLVSVGRLERRVSDGGAVVLARKSR